MVEEHTDRCSSLEVSKIFEAVGESDGGFDLHKRKRKAGKCRYGQHLSHRQLPQEGAGLLLRYVGIGFQHEILLDCAQALHVHCELS